MQPFNAQTLEDLAARIGKAIEASPAADIEKNVKAMLQGGLARLDLVTREEFDPQPRAATQWVAGGVKRASSSATRASRRSSFARVLASTRA